MNQFDACKVLGLDGKITPKHVISAYGQIASDPLRSKQTMREINTAFSVMQNFNGHISIK